MERACEISLALIGRQTLYCRTSVSRVMVWTWHVCGWNSGQRSSASREHRARTKTFGKQRSFQFNHLGVHSSPSQSLQGRGGGRISHLLPPPPDLLHSNFRRGRAPTTSIQFRGEDLCILDLDLVNAGVLGLQVPDLELVALPQLPQTVLGLVVKAVGDHFTILSPRKEEGGSGPQRVPSTSCRNPTLAVFSHWPRHQTTFQEPPRGWGGGPGRGWRAGLGGLENRECEVKEYHTRRVPDSGRGVNNQVPHKRHLRVGDLSSD